ncbi:MAG: restriction endonuclease subunit S [Capnocytophaga leadbetteri]|jgi:restriction modification system DNA specificity domain protein|uniref:restriction endonuclease subunit S n=1 Tax=Capnocytophaga leadbetteri TaxID=327575 RepID=UPI0028D134F4|nr:restriction endonuclease subunit S [Capnocytophaga leadbetteri]
MTAKIPKHWKIKKLGDVLEIFPTASYSRSELSDEGEIQYIHYGDIHTKFDSLLEITDDTLPKISKSKGEKYEIILLGDLVMVDASEDYQGVGKSTEVIALSRYNTIAGLHTFLLRDKGEYFCLGYKGYITMSDYVKKQLYIAATGTKVYSLSKESLKLIQLPIPPLKEQEKIAEILLSCDKAIRLTTQIITQLKQRNQGLAQQLLTGEKRVKGFENSIWKSYSISEICKIGRGRVISAKYISENKGIYPVYSSQTQNEGVFGKINTYDFEGEYITWTTDGVNAGTVSFREGKFNCTNVCGTLKVINVNNFSHKFLAYKLATIAFQYVSYTLANPKLMNNTMGDIIINLPEITEQNAIAQILDTAHQELKLYEQKLQLLQAQKKTLMQKLLTGEVLTIK